MATCSYPPHSLNDYLWRGVKIKKTAIDVTRRGGSGQLFLIPSSTKAGEMTRILHYPSGEQHIDASSGQVVSFSRLRSLIFELHAEKSRLRARHAIDSK